jgi:hypothetical protein
MRSITADDKIDLFLLKSVSLAMLATLLRRFERIILPAPWPASPYRRPHKSLEPDIVR